MMTHQSELRLAQLQWVTQNHTNKKNVNHNTLDRKSVDSYVELELLPKSRDLNSLNIWTVL